MDVLQDMFRGHDPRELHRAFTQANGDIETAIEIILAESDDLQSRALRQAELAPELEDPERPLLSPSSSADSLQALKISDVEDFEARDDELQQVPSPDECLVGVLAIFPDACTEYIRKLYQENQHGDIIRFIAEKLAEGGYPRAAPEPKTSQKRKRPTAEEEEDDEDGKGYEAEHRTVSDKYSGFV